MTPAADEPVFDVSTTGRHIPALDGLRGLAILLVLMCHLLASNPYPDGNAIVRLLARMHNDGWTGVSLFFVLSGFLITGILYDTQTDRHFFKNFYARRMLRIFPLYYGFLLLLFLITRFTGNHWYSGFAQILTYTENLPIVGLRYTDAWWINLNHFWSLAIEEQFYFVWPLLVFFLKTRRRIVVAAISGIILSFSIRLAWVLFSNLAAHPYVVYSWTPSQLDGLLFGGLLAITIRSRFRVRAIKIAPYILAIGSLIALVIWFHNGSLDWQAHPFIAVIEPLLLAFTFGGLLLCCLRPRSWQQRLFEHPIFRFFGRYSYGLYVFHYTLVSVILDPMRIHLNMKGYSKIISLLLPAAITLVVSIVAAWLSFRYFEAPFLSLKDRFTNRSRHSRLQDAIPSSLQ